MNNYLLLNVLNKTLGPSKKTSRNNYSFKCPNGCHPHKNKLEINLNTHQYQCWICGSSKEGIKGKNLIKLFKQVKASPEALLELRSIVKTETADREEIVTEKVELPKEFQSLLNISKSNIVGRHALAYLKSRNINEEDILKYNIGYCESGPYRNMVVIPSYDEDGTLNYFTGRSFEKESKIKYKNPTVSRDIIPFELFINWDIPFILCEGPFDAIAIKRNVIPLLGKNIQTKLMKKIVMSSVDKIYIALDRDAQKQALSFCEQLMNEGKEVYLVDMQDKDPSEMGFKNFINLISETYPLTFSGLLEKKFYL
jgi:DNA primase